MQYDAVDMYVWYIEEDFYWCLAFIHVFEHNPSFAVFPPLKFFSYSELAYTKCSMTYIRNNLY